MNAPAALRGAAAALGLAACPASSGDDTPTTPVTGSSPITYAFLGGDTVTVDENLTGYTIAAYIPDDGDASGFRVVPATIDGGRFEIPDVPDRPYYLQLIYPPAGPTPGPAGPVIPRFYATEARTLDLGYVACGRPDAAAATAATPIELRLTGMEAWRGDDTVVLDSFTTGTEHTVFGADPYPAVGDRALATTVDWRKAYTYQHVSIPRLVDAAREDDLNIYHVATRYQHGAGGYIAGVSRIADAFSTRAVTMVDGEAAAPLEGAFAPVVADQVQNVSADLEAYDRALHDGDAAAHRYIDVYRLGNQAGGQGALFGVRLLRLVQLLSPAMNRFDVRGLRYGDPLHRGVTHVMLDYYSRYRYLKAPGATTPMLVGSHVISVRPAERDHAMRPLVASVTEPRVAGRPALTGGVAPFDGVHPVAVAWTAADGADYYTVIVQKLGVDDGQTRLTPVASLSTAGTSIQIPAMLLERGAFYVLEIVAVADGSGFAAGALRRSGLPRAHGRIASGLFRFSDRCGDGRVDDEEECDDASPSPTCDDDCTMAACGDGTVNAAAGEACDTVTGSLHCDPDCTPVACNDGVLNLAGEACDDGMAGDQGNGCSATCTRIGACGDGVVQSLFEICDDGNDSVDDDCPLCIRAVCGDGWVDRQGPATEQCDDGNIDAGDGCSANCRNE